jgi:hypothetical protein
MNWYTLRKIVRGEVQFGKCFPPAVCGVVASVSQKLPFAQENCDEQERAGDTAPKKETGLDIPIDDAAGEIAQRDFV